MPYHDCEEMELNRLYEKVSRQAEEIERLRHFAKCLMDDDANQVAYLMCEHPSLAALAEHP